MNIHANRPFLLLLIIVLFSSCEALLFEPSKASTDPSENFEYLWNQIDKKYSYFELKNIDWDSVYTVYNKRISADMDEEQLFDVLAAMMNELRDDHSNLIAPFDVSRYNLYLQKSENYHQRTILEHYVPNIKYTGAFQHGIIGKANVGYIRYSSFMNGISSIDLDYVLNQMSGTQGLIIDLRNNGGGNIFNVLSFLERFNAEKKMVGYFITRNGEAHSDFSTPEEFYISAHSGINYLNPVMVLIDRGSYSATTMFALAAKAIDNITLLGDTTGGGGGLPNGGELPNGWEYRFSIGQLLDINGNNYAENGIPPDVTARFDWSDLTTDEILEQAIAEIENIDGLARNE